jgi:hypothetical protein
MTSPALDLLVLLSVILGSSMLFCVPSHTSNPPTLIVMELLHIDAVNPLTRNLQ